MSRGRAQAGYGPWRPPIRMTATILSIRAMPAPRIALGGFMLESNGHSPVATREEFEQHFVASGAELESDWHREHPRAPLTLTGFVNAMNGTDTWTPVPLMCAAAGASGPVD